MTKAAALYDFWSGFGLDAYEENAVPTGDGAPAYPYITYELITSGDLDRSIGSASVWYRGSSWTDANAKAEAISDAIGEGVTLLCDKGAIIVRKSSPFARSMGDDVDNMIKRKILSVEYFYATKN